MHNPSQQQLVDQDEKGKQERVVDQRLGIVASQSSTSQHDNTKDTTHSLSSSSSSGGGVGPTLLRDNVRLQPNPQSANTSPSPFNRRKPSKPSNYFAGSSKPGLGTSPTFFCGQTARSSMLAFETSDLGHDGDDDDNGSSQPKSNETVSCSTASTRNAVSASSEFSVNFNPSRMSLSSCSSSDDELATGYDSDDRMSVASRRASCSVRLPYSPLLGATIVNKDPKLLKEDITLEGKMPEYIRESSSENINAGEAESGGSYELPALHAQDSVKPNPRISMRQTGSSARLRPKMKSFLRVSKELQDELAPLDCEMQREAELTSCFRRLSSSYSASPSRRASAINLTDDSSAIRPKPNEQQVFALDEENIILAEKHARSTDSFFQPPISNGAPLNPNSHAQRASLHPNKELLSRLQGIKRRPSSSTSKEKSFASDSEADTHTFKRKVDLIEDMFDSHESVKRRAVSPGLSSPLLNSPTHFGKVASLRQLSDTSDGLQKMSL